MYELITLQPLFTANLRLSPSLFRTVTELCRYERYVVFCWRAFQLHPFCSAQWMVRSVYNAKRDRETERQNEMRPPPPPLIPALLLPSQNVLVICCCCCLLDYLETLLVLGLETNTDDSRLLMIQSRPYISTVCNFNFTFHVFDWSQIEFLKEL